MGDDPDTGDTTLRVDANKIVDWFAGIRRYLQHVRCEEHVTQEALALTHRSGRRSALQLAKIGSLREKLADSGIAISNARSMSMARYAAQKCSETESSV